MPSWSVNLTMKTIRDKVSSRFSGPLVIKLSTMDITGVYSFSVSISSLQGDGSSGIVASNVFFCMGTWVGHCGCNGQIGGVARLSREKKGVLDGGKVGDSTGKTGSGCGEEPPAGVKYCGDPGPSESTELADGSGIILGRGRDFGLGRKTTGSGDGGGEGSGEGGGDGKSGSNLFVNVSNGGTGGGDEGGITKRSFGRFVNSDIDDLLRPSLASIGRAAIGFFGSVCTETLVFPLSLQGFAEDAGGLSSFSSFEDERRLM